MRRVLLLICLAAAFVALLAPEAMAFKRGDMDINIRGGVSGRYDDNINYDHTNQERDYITSLTAGMDIIKQTRRMDASFSGNLTQELFSTYHKNHNLAEDFVLAVNQDLTKHDTVTMSDSFLHADAPRGFEDEFGNQLGRYEYIQNSFNLGWDHELTQQISYGASYINGCFVPLPKDNEKMTESYLDRGRFYIAYMPTTMTTVSVMFDETYRYYIPGTFKFTHTPYLSLKHAITEQLIYDCTLGVDFMPSRSGKLYYKPNISTGLTNLFSKKLYWSCRFDKRYDQTYYTSDISNYWSISGTLGGEITKRLRASGSIFMGQAAYTNPKYTDSNYGMNLGAYYDITEHWSANVGYNIAIQDSTVNDSAYTKNVISAGLSLFF
jgi:hypothetical protein